MTTHSAPAKRTRSHYTPDQIQSILCRYHKSQLTQKAFARQAGIHHGTLGRWLRAAPSSSPRLVEIAVPAVHSFNASNTVRIELPNGVTLCLAEDNFERNMPALLTLIQWPLA